MAPVAGLLCVAQALAQTGTPDGSQLPSLAGAQTGSRSGSGPSAQSGLATGAPAGAPVFSVQGPALHVNQPIDAAHVYNKNGCDGHNSSPELTWHNAPRGTRGFAITVFDADAPGRGWWHWAVAGIPASITHLPANASASGFLKQLGAIEARNDFGEDGYGGPCPPAGKPHRYVITVWALKTDDLRLASGRPAPMFEHELAIAALATAQLVVTFGR
jgi:Raf kinase inhibitor-like YbhB/YbcL family protein